MNLANNKIIPPKEWQHSPELKNMLGETVATLLAKHKIIPPKEWIYNSEELN